MQIFNFRDGHVTTFRHPSGAYIAQISVREYVFNVFQNPKSEFLRFCALLHTFSRTMHILFRLLTWPSPSVSSTLRSVSNR